MSKTKAIWFGKKYNCNQKLCQDLKLDWDTKFRLLGVDFDNNLDNMDSNFPQKIKAIEKLLNCWIYRTLTVYGKITIIKTLALPKLSHLALVLPNLNKTQIKIIESMFFKFLWVVPICMGCPDLHRLSRLWFFACALACACACGRARPGQNAPHAPAACPHRAPGA